MAPEGCRWRHNVTLGADMEQDFGVKVHEIGQKATKVWRSVGALYRFDQMNQKNSQGWNRSVQHGAILCK